MKFIAKRCREEEEELLVYRNVTVYVRRLTGSERLPEKDMSDPDYEYLNGIGNNCETYEVLLSPFCFKDFVKSTFFVSILGGHGRKNGLSNGHYHSNNSDFVRRSNRRQKVRGEKEFSVSSDMLLRDFKVKVNFMFMVQNYQLNSILKWCS